LDTAAVDVISCPASGVASDCCSSGAAVGVMNPAASVVGWPGCSSAGVADVGGLHAFVVRPFSKRAGSRFAIDSAVPFISHFRRVEGGCGGDSVLAGGISVPTSLGSSRSSFSPQRLSGDRSGRLLPGGGPWRWTGLGALRWRVPCASGAGRALRRCRYRVERI
jgi:hypothetical protein